MSDELITEAATTTRRIVPEGREKSHKIRALSKSSIPTNLFVVDVFAYGGICRLEHVLFLGGHGVLEDTSAP